MESAYGEAAATKAAPKGAAENGSRRLSAFAASDFFGDRQPLPGELVPMQFSSRAFGLRLLFSALSRLLAVDVRRIGRSAGSVAALCIGFIARSARARREEGASML
jgi:hypothetical protein